MTELDWIVVVLIFMLLCKDMSGKYALQDIVDELSEIRKVLDKQNRESK